MKKMNVLENKQPCFKINLELVSTRDLVENSQKSLI